jgi:protein required for attachment to host cells
MTEVHIPHEALILIADGERALFLRNEGSPQNVKLAVERVLEQDNPATREQGTDRPGRTNSRMATRRSAIDEIDWHQLGEDRFAGEIAAALYRLIQANRDLKLVLVAPPKTLGELRKSLHSEVIAGIAAEIPKELTAHSLPNIERLLSS